MKFIASAVLCIALFVGNTFAQRLGHVDSEQLLKLMPETPTAQKQLETEAKQLQDAMETMQVEYNQKLQDYMAKADSLSPLIRSNKEEELRDLGERIQTFKDNAQTSLQEKQEQLFKPIMDKAKKAIEDVGKENGFTYIFDMSAGNILYFGDKGEDVLPLVKKKLGIQ